MRKIFSIVFLVCATYLTNAESVTQQIRFTCKGAGEVYLVWGIDNWQLPSDKVLPAGSFIKDNLVYTLLEKKGEGFFAANLTLKAGTLIDYVFWITKGPLQMGTDIWDTNTAAGSGNKKDYHTLAVANSITLVESHLTAIPAKALSIVDFAYVLLVVAAGIFMLIFLLFKLSSRTLLQNKPYLLISSTSISLVFALFLIRPTLLGFSWDLLTDPVVFTTHFLWAGFYDALYVGAFFVIFYAAIFLLKKYPRAQTTVTFLFIALSLMSLIIAILNIKIVEMLGKPFNYQWLYYSDFLRSADARLAISANISFSDIARIICLCLVFILAGLSVLAICNNLFQKKRLRLAALTIFLLGSGIYLFIAPKKLSARNWNYDLLANPVTAFVASVNPFSSSPALFTMAVSDSLTYVKPGHSFSKKHIHKKIRNVIFFVLESTPAEYIDTYGSRYAVTPTLKKYGDHSVKFENVYAHAPATNLSMVSLLGSVYPWLSYNSFTEEHPDINIPTISSLLKEKGYRTAFFNSADNRYQKAEEFLGHRNFDVVNDCRDDACGNSKFTVNNTNWNYMDGKDDLCSKNQMSEWIMQDTSKPFFAMMWTYQTHYPYFFKGSQKTHDPNDSVFNRYLNALNYADGALNDLIEDLKRNMLFESTLLVVLGDHGEAFGRHGQITHGRKIYEENLHIPCLFINPQFKEENISGVSGMIDVAPTVLNILGLNPPEEWEGESMFVKNMKSKVFFFAPWSDYLFGYRQNRYKYIYNASNNTTEIYDLRKDPQESVNLMIKKQGELKCHHQRLAGWTQYVNRSVEAILKRPGVNNKTLQARLH
jgi:lipoteichoic acid synthase